METSALRCAAGCCPRRLAHFVLVYEAFHQTLRQQLPKNTILPSVDDIAVISPN